MKLDRNCGSSTDSAVRVGHKAGCYTAAGLWAAPTFDTAHAPGSVLFISDADLYGAVLDVALAPFIRDELKSTASKRWCADGDDTAPGRARRLRPLPGAFPKSMGEIG